MSGASENQAKKQTKNASQLMWKARIAGDEKEKIERRVALAAPEFILSLSMIGVVVRVISSAARSG
jgi:hypothetical protein